MPEISNPNLQTQGPGGGGGGGDMRSTMMFFGLMLVVLFGYQYFFPSKPSAKPAPAAQTQTQPEQQAATPAPVILPAAVGTPGSPAIVAAAESDVTVENALYKIVFTNQGAQVKHWFLKKYFDAEGKPLDLVQPELAKSFGLPLSLFTYDTGLSKQLNQALYQVTAGNGNPVTSAVLQAPATLSFHYQANGLNVVKTLHFDSTYVVDVETQVLRNGAPVRALVEWPAGLGDMDEFAPQNAAQASKGAAIRASVASQFVWSIDGKQDATVAKKVSGDATFTEPYQYAAVDDLYFAASFLPENPAGTTVVTLHHSVDLPSDLSDPNSRKTPADVIGLAVGDTSGYNHLRLFVGPKATDVLASVHATGADGKPTGQSLQPLIQYGMWTIIAKPLYLALRFLVEHGIGNWGWAIIIVTVIFNLFMLPTRIMMMKSSLKMMRIQPRVDAIKRKFSHLKVNDPKRTEMNTEMMALYKTEGVNMYGSCLPMLVQIPLFFAYFRVLQYAVELRQAHWIWLPDLAAPDPTHVLPILIIVTMFLTQYITPSPGMDPAQRRMMAFLMPVMFGFMLWHYASGLALYWGTGNLINLAMQVIINQSGIGKEMHAISAKRAAKKLGNSPKVIQGRH